MSFKNHYVLLKTMRKHLFPKWTTEYILIYNPFSMHTTFMSIFCMEKEG